MDPSQRLRAWLPHLVLIALVAAVVAILAVVVWPLRDPLLLAGAIALLTYPLAFAPLVRRLAIWAPHWDGAQRRLAAAALATGVVGVAGALAASIGLWLIFGRLEHVGELLRGVLFGDPRALDHAIAALVRKLTRLLEPYPQLAWEPSAIRAWLYDLLGKGAVGSDMLGFLLRGTIGLMATAAMTLIALFYLYAQGPHLFGLMMRWLPLSAQRRDELVVRFERLTVYVAASLLGRALLHGMVCGAIAWLIAGANPLATGAVAAFLALLPVVGPGIAWVPYASVLWTTGRELEAVSLAVACISAAWVVELAFARLARRLGADGTWLGFLLFCGLVGGVASFGLRGIIIGPAAALTAAALFGFLPAIYGVGGDPPARDDDAPT